MSDDTREYLLTSSHTTRRHSIRLWDCKSYNNLQSYNNGGSTVIKSLQQIGNDYLLTAEQNKPLLHVWPVNSQEQMKNARFILPGVAEALTVSPDNNYLAVAIGTKLYIWQLCSGTLLSVTEEHLFPISCIKFASNLDFLVTTSTNGTTITYNFGHLIDLHNNTLAQNKIGSVKPLYVVMDHISKITDLYVGNCGLKSRFITVSVDRTLRIYSLYEGECLLQLIFNEELSSVIADNCFLTVFIGTVSGKINQVNLMNPPRTLSEHVKPNNEIVFRGHRNKINCLHLNCTADLLVSGSNDFSAIIWDVFSQEMIYKIKHQDIVTNVLFIMKNENLFAQNFKPHCVLRELQRTISSDSEMLISIVQDNDIVFEDEESKASLIKCIDNLEEDVINQTTCNNMLYNHLISSIKQ